MQTRKIKKAIRRWYRRAVDFITPSKSTIKGAGWGIIIVSALVHFFANMEYAGFIGIHFWAIFLITMLMAGYLGGLLAHPLIRLLHKIPALIKTAIIVALSVVMFSFAINQKTSLFTLAIILVCASLAGAGIRHLIKRRHSSGSVGQVIIPTLAGLIGIVGLAAATWWIIHPGSHVEPPYHAAMQSPALPGHLQLANPAEEGPYHVTAITYGSGTDKRRPEFGAEATLISRTVDGSPFLDSWDGWRGKLRTRYFGFGKDSLPLNGRVWYPDSKDASPLVLIVHGNHLAQDFSDPGYAYLGELLASRGYIVVSVDQNFINGSFTNIMKGFGGENDARGWLLLKHLEMWRDWNEQEGHRFFGKVDMDRIALIGHSRGGEAVSHAALFNTLPYFPDDANQPFSFGFGIRSVIAIAPVDGQYQPSGILTPIHDVNFLTLQGSHDADMQSYHGQRQFKRVQFSDGFDRFKAGLYIYGANHGQFNSVWGRKDFFSPRINFFNLRQLMPEKEQQKIAQVAISAFLEATLNDEKAYRRFFMDSRTGRDWLPETIYLNQYQETGTLFVCQYDEDLDLTTTSLPGGHIETAHLTTWKERLVPMKWGNLDTRAVYIGWDRNKDKQEDEEAYNEMAESGTNSSHDDDLREEAEEGEVPSYTVILPEGSIPDATNKALVFFLADGGEADEDADQGIDFTIELADTDGQVVRFELSDHKFLQPAIKIQMGKLSFMSTAPGTEIVFDTFIFPIRAILEKDALADSGFSPEKLASIRFVFDKTEKATIILNDLGFMDWH